VYQENLSQEQAAVLSHARNLIGAHTYQVAENCLMILNSTDLKLLHLLSTSGALAPEILHTAKYMSNGNVKYYQEMNYLMESVSGTMATLEPSNFSNPKHYE
jgi:hypothetical protein